jgi:phenylacetic acid degradation operon negative regulatory protein
LDPGTVPVVSDTIGAGSTTVPTRLLVYSMVHADGSVEAAELLPVAAACGLSADQVRSCLRRMVAEGLYAREGSGRDARYLPTEAGRCAIDGYFERTRLAYAQDLAGRGWDRHWHLVAFGIPESRRAGRDALRDRLLALGGASIHNGLYVSPHRWEDDVRRTAEAHDVLDAVTLVTTDELLVGGDGDPRRLAARLWPLDDLAARYQAFVDHHTFVAGYLEDLRTKRGHLDEEAFISGALRTTVEFEAVFNGDPLLPPELLPRPWPGRAARELFLRNRRLGMQLRGTSGRPTLFAAYDALIESVR